MVGGQCRCRLRTVATSICLPSTVNAFYVVPSTRYCSKFANVRGIDCIIRFDTKSACEAQTKIHISLSVLKQLVI